eukprot:3937636-Rhodomonas_salina.1
MVRRRQQSLDERRHATAGSEVQHRARAEPFEIKGQGSRTSFEQFEGHGLHAHVSGQHERMLRLDALEIDETLVVRFWF